MTKRYFTPKEFACSCCGVSTMKPSFLYLLNKARADAGVSFVITSGYRCPEHNAEVGGVKGSSHTKGCAVDIRCTSGNKRFKVIQSLLDAGFTRVGVSKNFIHVDNDESKPANVIWTY